MATGPPRSAPSPSGRRRCRSARTPSDHPCQRGAAMTKRGGLGRGLAALIPTGPAPTPPPVA
ncbi:hypothetical protein E9565_17290, partial [Blastococcus sp. KM273129]|nr:hypothetical protein [Blastococcus sp. KM273129]